MLDHVTIRASDRAASEAFYKTVLDAIEIEQTHSGERPRVERLLAGRLRAQNDR